MSEKTGGFGSFILKVRGKSQGGCGCGAPQTEKSEGSEGLGTSSCCGAELTLDVEPKEGGASGSCCGATVEATGGSCCGESQGSAAESGSDSRRGA